ncbi:MAG: outer membrane lipoprotein carrier protein LolA [Ignavibacteria bacterium]|nr:outer membrane lipoprotein carrier protein LolA [Ignavibacteria bacterium]
MKHNRIKITLLLSAILIGMVPSRGVCQQSAEQIYSAVVKKYGSMTSLKVNFISNPGSPMKGGGIVKAKKGNKFVLDLGERILVSNGVTVWNYSKSANSVVISNFEDKGQISIEKVFFTFLQSYKASASFSEQTSTGQKLTTLRLIPPTPEDMISGVKSIELGLSPKTLDVLRITITDASTQKWNVSSLKINVKFPDSTFNFTPPKGVKSVDMR